MSENDKQEEVLLKKRKRKLIILVTVAMVVVFLLWLFVFFPKSKDSFKEGKKLPVGSLYEKLRSGMQEARPQEEVPKKARNEPQEKNQEPLPSRLPLSEEVEE
ncbi:hypothetical protein KKC60_02655 [Patescibacteria group bacterium]|nr:hypothetical protein [Patescibacteria group bacterium]